MILGFYRNPKIFLLFLINILSKPYIVRAFNLFEIHFKNILVFVKMPKKSIKTITY